MHGGQAAPHPMDWSVHTSMNATPTTFSVDKSTSALWRVTFRNPPINLINAKMLSELQQLLTELESSDLVAVIVFDSADPDYFLAHFDIAADQADVTSLPPGRTGLTPWLDVLIRISELPMVTITALRGRARGAGSELALATDIRFASREKAILGQFELGTGAVPGGGPATRLPGIVGRGRAMEILLGADDFDGDLAERYGYVNRSIADEQFEKFVDDFAKRVSQFDVRAIAEIKGFVNDVSLPETDAFPPQMVAFVNSFFRPETVDRVTQILDLGLQQRSDIELHLGAAVEQITPPTPVGRSRT
jgi:enoyl-CoA hydratase/carnithine racemase